jgi:DNA polymerase-3 subunit delta
MSDHDRPALEHVYLLTGSDRPKVERALRRLRARVGEDAVENLAAAETSGADAAAACNALGLLVGEARLVVVEGVEAWRKDDVDALAAYLADPAPATVLALVAAELKGDSALAKLCARHGRVLEFAVARRELAHWAAAQFELAGGKAEPDACVALLHLVGEDPQALATEIDKLATWAAGEPVGEREVELLVAETADAPVFTLTDAVGERDVSRALAASEAIFERRAKPRRDTAPILVGALAAHLARLRDLRRLAADGVSAQDAAPRLRLHPFRARKLAAQADGFSDAELAAATVRLAELDVALKGRSRLTPDLEVQRAVIDIAGTGRRRAG